MPDNSFRRTRFRVRAPGRAVNHGARNLGTRMPGDRADETARRTVDLLPVPGAGQARERQLQHDRADGPIQPVLRPRVGRPAPPACRQAAQGDCRHQVRAVAAGPATASSATRTSETAGRARAPASRRRAGTPSPGCARRSSRRIRKAPGRTRPSAPRWCGSPGARLWRCRTPAAHGTSFVMAAILVPLGLGGGVSAAARGPHHRRAVHALLRRRDGVPGPVGG